MFVDRVALFLFSPNLFLGGEYRKIEDLSFGTKRGETFLPHASMMSQHAGSSGEGSQK